MSLPSWVRGENKRYNPGNQIQLGNLSGAWHSNCVARVEILSGKSCRNQLSGREDQNQFGQAGPSLSGAKVNKAWTIRRSLWCAFYIPKWLNQSPPSFLWGSFLDTVGPVRPGPPVSMRRSVVSMPSHVPCLHPILGLHPLAHQIPISSYIPIWVDRMYVLA